MSGTVGIHAGNYGPAWQMNAEILTGGPTADTQVWSYPNTHGDYVATADGAGVKQGATATYDPYGNLTSGAVPDNSAGSMDYGWLGQHQRPLEQQAGLEPMIEMGARQYSSRLGRFLEVDPIEGGSCTDYDYVCNDPINRLDLDGQRCHSWDASSHTTASWNATIRGSRPYSLKVKLLCGEGGAGGYGLRHIRKASNGRNHITDFSRGVEKRLGIPVTEQNYIDVIGQIVQNGSQQRIRGGQIRFQGWTRFVNTDDGRCREYHMNVYVIETTGSVKSAYVDDSRHC